jgi:hypothetical protein
VPLSWLVVVSPHYLHRGIDVCAFKAMVNKMFNKSVPCEDFELMNEATIHEVKSNNQAYKNGQEVTLKI